jgi:hypothetical protein
MAGAMEVIATAPIDFALLLTTFENRMSANDMHISLLRARL